MSRYIDADRLLNGLKSDALYPLVEKYGIERVIDAQPTADVRENVRANFVIAGYKRDGSTQWFECSACGGAVDFTDNCCKHCGAYFREVVNNERKQMGV